MGHSIGEKISQAALHIGNTAYTVVEFVYKHPKESIGVLSVGAAIAISSSSCGRTESPEAQDKLEAKVVQLANEIDKDIKAAETNGEVTIGGDWARRFKYLLGKYLSKKIEETPDSVAFKSLMYDPSLLTRSGFDDTTLTLKDGSKLKTFDLRGNVEHKVDTLVVRWYIPKKGEEVDIEQTAEYEYPVGVNDVYYHNLSNPRVSVTFYREGGLEKVVTPLDMQELLYRTLLREFAKEHNISDPRDVTFREEGGLAHVVLPQKTQNDIYREVFREYARNMPRFIDKEMERREGVLGSKTYHKLKKYEGALKHYRNAVVRARNNLPGKHR